MPAFGGWWTVVPSFTGKSLTFEVFLKTKNKNNKPKVNTKAINHTERGGGVYSASQPCHFRIVLFVQQIHYRVGLTSLRRVHGHAVVPRWWTPRLVCVEWRLRKHQSAANRDCDLRNVLDRLRNVKRNKHLLGWSPGSSWLISERKKDKTGNSELTSDRMTDVSSTRIF